MPDRPYLTSEHPPVPLAFKRRWEDFTVEEIPAYPPEGAGDHTFFEIEKRGLATHRAVGDIARALGIRPADVGVAGLKDARSVSRQWLSVERIQPERVLALDIPRIRVLQVHRHPRKLRRGHHRGNHFGIKLRPGTGHDREARAAHGPSGSNGAAAISHYIPAVRAVLDVLERRGVPNYYGAQRFGSRGDTWQVGRAMARRDFDEAVALIAGRPTDADSGDVLHARTLFGQGRYAEAAHAWPRGYRQCVRLCRAMDRRSDTARALHAVGKRMLRFYASAYQSWLFNQVLAARIDSMDGLLDGDLAWKHLNGALFLVDDAAAEQARAGAFEISPTGPLVGKRMRQPERKAASLECGVLEAAGLEPDQLHSPAMKPLGGSRRPLRFPVSDVALEQGTDDLGPFLLLRFTLPPGGYATEVLREIAKDQLVEGTGQEG